MRLGTHVSRLLFFLLIAYGFFYFSYKWLIPTVVNSDFTQYYGMILHPLDFHAAPSPWVYRQWNALVAHEIWKVHIYYPDLIRFADPGYDQHVFFAALFTNFLAVVFTAWLTTLIVEGWLGRSSHIVPLFGGMLCFFSFLLQETTLTGQADGLTWTLVALCYLLYQRRKLGWFSLVVMLSIFQREILPLIFCTLAVVTALLQPAASGREPADFSERSYQCRIAAVSAFGFAVYLLVRHVIHAPGNENQMDPSSQLKSILRFRLDSAYFKQVILGQNLLLLLCGIWILVYIRLRESTRRMLPLLATCVLLIIISIMTQIGSNATRMLALLTPIVAAEITFALARLDDAATAAAATSAMPTQL